MRPRTFSVAFVTSALLTLSLEAHECAESFEQVIPDESFELIFRDPLRRRCRSAVDDMYRQFGEGRLFSIGKNGFLEHSPERQVALLNYARFCLPRPLELDDQLGEIAQVILGRIVLITEPPSKQPICTGFLTDDHTVVTARHCLYEASGDVIDIEFKEGGKCRAGKLVDPSELDFYYKTEDGEVHTLEGGKVQIPTIGVYKDHPNRFCSIYQGGRAGPSAFKGYESDWIEIRFEKGRRPAPLSTGIYRYTDGSFQVDQYLFVSFSKAKWFESRLTEPHLNANDAMFNSVTLDTSVMCAPFHHDGALFNHSCQSLEYGSGSPMFKIEEISFSGDNMNPRQFSLIGINTGSAPFFSSCSLEDAQYFDTTNIGFNSGTSQFLQK